MLFGKAAFKARNMLFSLAPDAQFKPVGQRIHNRDANTVQTTGNFVGIAVKLTTSVQLGHNNLGRRNAFALVNAHRDAATVIADRNGVIFVNCNVHGVRMTSQCFVDSVVHDLVHHVMQSRSVVGIADIHTGALANSF